MPLALLCAAACTPAEPAESTGSIEPPAPPTKKAPAVETNTDEPSPAPAILLGAVAFSPTSPVIQKDAPTAEVPPEAFEGRMVLVLAPDGETRIAETGLDPTGVFRIELPPGDYVVDLTLFGIERSESVPVAINLREGETLELEIVVDTGIR